ncbi:MAG: WHG domain-containing protein [Pseudomonadota bacterium]
MARSKRSPADTEAMRERLIDAARRMIEAEGLGAVTARALAAELGWSVGSIYTIAPSIDAVTLEANARELADLSAAFEARRAELGAAGATPALMLRAFAEIYLRFATARPRSWAAIFERDAEGEPPEWYRGLQTRLFALLAETVRPAVRSNAEARRAARTLWAALHGLLALSLAGHLDRVTKADRDEAATSAAAAAEEDLESHAFEMIDVYLNGLAQR